MNKQPPDFSGWRITAHKINVFWDEEKGKLIPTLEKRPKEGFLWWGTANFYQYPPNPDISGTEMLAFGKCVVLKIWGFSGDDAKSIAALIDGAWYVIDEKRGEDIDVDSSEMVNGRIVKTVVSVLRADKTVIGTTVVNI